MRGLSPAIAVILLILLGIGAIGGIWFWYKSVEQKALSGGSSSFQKISSLAGVTLQIDKTSSSCSSGTANLTLTFANLGVNDAKITRIVLENESKKEVGSYDVDLTVPADGFASVTLVNASLASEGCTSTMYVTVYSGSSRLLSKEPVEVTCYNQACSEVI